MNMTNLQKQIENLNQTMSSQLPQEILNAFADSIADLKKDRIEDRSFRKGMKARSFSLKSSQGKTINSDNLLGEYDKIILVFFRGDWCPYCNLELRALQEALSRIENKKAKLIAVSPQKQEYSSDMREKNQLSFDILFDKDNTLANQFGISFNFQDFVVPYYLQLGIDLNVHNGNNQNALPIPAVFVIDKDYNITYSFVDADYMTRVDIEDLIKNL